MKTRDIIKLLVAPCSTLFLLSTLAVGQKGTPPSTQGAIVKSKSNITNNRNSAAINGEVKLGTVGSSESSARTFTIDSNGEIDLKVLERGSYWIQLRIPLFGPVAKSSENEYSPADPGDVYIVKIDGAEGGTAEWMVDASKSHDMTKSVIQNIRARTTRPMDTDKIPFSADGASAVKLKITKRSR